MAKSDSIIHLFAKAISRALSKPSLAGQVWGGIGVLAFSLTFPMTRLAVSEIDPLLVGLGRAVVAAGLAVAWLASRPINFPASGDWPRLALVALGVVFGFSLFSSIGLRFVPSTHAAVVAGLLPVSTAVIAVLREGERPKASFWAAAIFGLVAVLGFAIVQGAGAPEPAGTA